MEEVFTRGFNSLHLHFNLGNNQIFRSVLKNLFKKPLINNQIRVPQVRVIDETGKQIGIVNTEEALRLARERNLDLIQVTEKVSPPVCRIMEYGKYLYSLQKKNKTTKQHGGEMKGIRLTFNISTHDMEVRAEAAYKFLQKGDKVRVEMVLRGRERSLEGFARQKINQFIEAVNRRLPIKTERTVKKEARGLTAIIAKQ